MELKEGAVIAERFRLLRLLGKGGMGEVWAAQHTSLDIPCAVKFIHAESAEKPDVRMRFEREAKAAAQLRSPNVVQILDYGVFESTPYIAMEYLDGEPLNARLQRHGRLDAHETYRIVSGVGKALVKAHAAGIVHRDLKPENIYLVRDDEGETPKVLDFGVAKRTTGLDSNTRTGALLGTPYYMSPEQAQGIKTIDARADLWSLAVLTYRCIVGELPFKSQALGDLLIKIVTHPIPVPSQVVSGVPEGFDAWWARASQREPDLRYQSARELIDALSMALSVSMPATMSGGTPMPGVMNQEVARSFGSSPQAVTNDPAAAPMAPTPFAHAQPARAAAPPTMPLPQVQQPLPQVHQQQPLPQVQQPALQQQYQQPAPLPQPIAVAVQQPGPGLGDSQSSASVAGVYAPTPAMPATRGSNHAAVFGAIAVVAVVAAGGAFALFRSAPDAASAAASSAELAEGPSSVEGSAGAVEGSAGAVEGSASADQPNAAPSASADEQEADEDGGAASGGAAPSAASAEAPPEEAPPAATAPPVRPTSRPKGIKTKLDVPKTPPPAKTYDPGF